MVNMRVLLMTAMMLCALSWLHWRRTGRSHLRGWRSPDAIRHYYCEFEILDEAEECGGPDGELYIENECYGTLKIEMTNTGDTPVHIITFVWWQYDAWMN